VAAKSRNNADTINNPTPRTSLREQRQLDQQQGRVIFCYLRLPRRAPSQTLVSTITGWISSGAM
jgi:hypothetical protein